MSLTIGYIGLGDIGGPMAERIARSQFDLVVWNRTPEKMAPHIAAGAAGAKSASEVGARCDIVFLCLDMPEAVEAVVFGPAGVWEGGRTKLIVDNSTVHPQKAQELAARAKQLGMRWLDAPVSGGSNGARTGTIKVFVGGDAADLEEARAVIMTYADRISHMGGPGTGVAAKACNQIFIFASMLAIAEAYTLGDRFGVATERLPEALAGGLAESGLWREYVRGVNAQGFNGITWHIDMIKQLFAGAVNPAARGKFAIGLKDAGIVMDLGRAASAPTPLTGLYETMLRILQHQNPA